MATNHDETLQERYARELAAMEPKTPMVKVMASNWQEDSLAPTWQQLHQAVAEYDELRAELQAARQEVMEQAKLNGMGAEREARLMAENAELRQENQRLAQAVKWESDLCQQALESRKELETENAELKSKLTDKACLLRGCYARINVLERALTHIHGVALAEDHRDLPGIAKDAKEALGSKT